MSTIEKKIEDTATACENSDSKKLRLQDAKYSDVGNILLKFPSQGRATNIPGSGPILMQKGKDISWKLNVGDAGFATEWLHKLRHGISCQVVSGESKDVLVNFFEQWFKHLASKIKGYQLRDTYNVDETDLFLLVQKLYPLKKIIVMVARKVKTIVVFHFL